MPKIPTTKSPPVVVTPITADYDSLGRGVALAEIADVRDLSIPDARKTSAALELGKMTHLAIATAERILLDRTTSKAFAPCTCGHARFYHGHDSPPIDGRPVFDSTPPYLRCSVPGCECEVRGGYKPGGKLVPYPPASEVRTFVNATTLHRDAWVGPRPTTNDEDRTSSVDPANSIEDRPKFKRTKIFGLSATKVVMRMGAMGLTEAQAAKALAALDVKFQTANTILTFLKAGATGKTTWGDPAALTKDQERQILALCK
jgi:hypothetical protein